VTSVGAVYCSDEQKALDGAAILGAHLGLTPVVLPELGEVDRSSTGFLAEADHAVAARLLFERPDESVCGWETARHAQARIVRAVDMVIARHALIDGDAAIIAHGAVGTLFLLHLLGAPIAFHHLQPGRDGGHYYAFDATARRLIHDWKRIEGDPP
jgi:broad specificity phosphatase PhoE